MVAPPSVSLNDLEYAYYKAAVPATDLGLAESLGQGIVTTSRQAALNEQTKINAAHVNAPGAGASVVNLNAAETGYYKVDVTVGFGATAESTALDNFQFLVNGATNGNGMIPASNVANWMSQTFTFYASIAAGQNFSVNAIAAASASSVYKASIMATRIA